MEIKDENLTSIDFSSVLWMKRLSFASILICSNMLENMFNSSQNSEDSLTSKQWLLMAIISSFKEMPTLSMTGEKMGCSRQNIKQIAQILRKKGYVDFCKSEGDRNTIRLCPTDKWWIYCRESDDETSAILDNIFAGFSDAQVAEFFKSFAKIKDNIEKVNSNIIEKKY